MRIPILVAAILVYCSGDSVAFSFDVSTFADNHLRFSRPLNSVSYLGVKTSMNLNNANSAKKTKNKELLNKSNKLTDPAKTSKPSIEKQYQYVQGGFNEVLPPTAENNTTTSMYAAFDSALRASSYNMFCSPLMPVEPPTPFRSKQKQNFRSSEPLSSEDETSKLIEQYQELDRYLSQSSGRSDIKAKNVSHETVDTRMEGRLRISDDFIAAARKVEAREEDYESLQNLLGFERMGTQGTSRMNSASIKGNMTKHRLVSRCCRVCLGSTHGDLNYSVLSRKECFSPKR
jgi:hypothetical protein